ncbi:3-hydroxypropanoate dehydrogenase [Anaerolineae bacterium]|nr:3-hydroxypropanoate dehydrogenase [Anaerolineae bacterium]
MDFFETIQARHSIRAFTAQPIEPEKLRAILDSANRAPSAGNLQGYEIFAVTNRTVLSALCFASFEQEFIAQAAIALVFCANPARSETKYGERGIGLYCIQDATIACAYAQLAATALGLASVWVGAFSDEATRDAIQIGDDLLPVAILPIGYPGKQPKIRPRRAIEDVVKYIR